MYGWVSRRDHASQKDMRGCDDFSRSALSDRIDGGQLRASNQFRNASTGSNEAARIAG
jgi:hypothetical protein